MLGPMSEDDEALHAHRAEPWYVSAFRGEYRLVYPHRDLASAEREVAWLLEQGLSGRVLDLCCGFGRHALALARAGLAVAGLDLSAELLAAARELPGAEVVLGRLVRADARRVPFRDGAFDGVTLLFSSFGYFGEQGDRRVLGEIARVLAPGGLAVLDLMNPAAVRSGLVPRTTRREAAFAIEERRRLADGGRKVVKEVELELTGAPGAAGAREVRRWREEVRLYEIDELHALLAERGLELVRVAGDFGATAFGPSSPRAIVFARRASERAGDRAARAGSPGRYTGGP
jgi:SAM-dependent methyltransferase